MVDVKIQATLPECIPVYQSEGAAGADLTANIPADAIMTIEPGQRQIVPTGVRVEIPDGYEIQIRSRSGLSWKNGIVVTNSPATIDSDFRGEICVILSNHGKETFTIKKGDRIAQMVLAPVCRANFISVEKLSNTERGTHGFGSTGK